MLEDFFEDRDIIETGPVEPFPLPPATLQNDFHSCPTDHGVIRVISQVEAQFDDEELGDLMLTRLMTTAYPTLVGMCQ